MGNIFKRSNQQGPKFRTVVPNHTVEEEIKLKTHPNYGYRSNRIKTTKYSVLTFFPKNIFEQFHRFANLYFIFVVGLNWVPEIQAFGKEIAMIPVIFVLAVTAIKDGFEDFRRYRSDKKINGQNCRVYSRWVFQIHVSGGRLWQYDKTYCHIQHFSGVSDYVFHKSAIDLLRPASLRAFIPH